MNQNMKSLEKKESRTVSVVVLMEFAALLWCCAQLMGCQPKPAETTTSVVEPPVCDPVAVVKETTYFPAIDRYLVNVIGDQYAKSEYCVPFYKIVSVDERDAENILVWGDFWLFNYNRSGDTLKTMSGGNHAGLLHIRQTDTGFEVTGFDQVAEGAGNMRSAQQIFGDKYEAFHDFHSNEQKREQRRLEVLADYVIKHNLGISYVQDFGWPAKQIVNFE